MSVKKAVKFCDILGESIDLNIKHKSKSKTFLGGLLTIATFCVLLGATWSMGNDIIYKDNPSTDLEDQLFLQRPTYYLNKYNFPFSFCFQDYDQNTYNIPKYFRFEIINVKTFNTNSTTVSTYYEYENCTFAHFPSLTEDYLINAGVGKYLCLKDQNITIGGYWDNEYVQYLTFRVRLCNNATDGGICAAQEEIQDFMNSQMFAWNVYFQNSIINPKNYYNATQYYIYDFYKNIRLSTTKLANVFVRSQEIETDIGILFESLANDISFAYDTSDIDDSDPIPDSLMDINFFVANHKPIFHRKYIKVQEIIANIGGLAKAFLIGMYIVSFYFSTIKLNTTILNKIFYFDLNESKADLTNNKKAYKINSHIVKKFQTNDEIINKIENENKTSNNKIILSDNGTNALIVNPRIEPRLIKFTKVKNESGKVAQNLNTLNLSFTKYDRTTSGKNKIKFSFCEILFSPFSKLIPCCKKNKLKFKLYKKSQKILLDCLDISNIVFKLEEFEKLKMILLNKEQLAMFQCISKDICTIDERATLYSDISKLKQFVRNKEEMFKMIADYKRKLEVEEENISKVDTKLFGMLDGSIKLKLLTN
jgi:hypothetical protein